MGDEPVERVPLEAEALSPDTVAELDTAAVRALPVHLGKRQCRVDDFFTVEGEASDELELRGDLRKVRWIGRGMSRGRITVVGKRRRVDLAVPELEPAEVAAFVADAWSRTARSKAPTLCSI